MTSSPSASTSALPLEQDAGDLNALNIPLQPGPQDEPETTGGVLSDELWDVVQSNVPVVCVDVVLARRRGDEIVQVGMIRRIDASGYSVTWCHLGGRILKEESVAQAVVRHVLETVGIDVSEQLGPDPQPDYVQQYFTEEGTHPELRAGVDTRKHSVGLSYLVELPGDLEVRAVRGGEGLEFKWFNVEQLNALSDVWPGSMRMVRRVLAAHQ